MKKSRSSVPESGETEMGCLKVLGDDDSFKKSMSVEEETLAQMCWQVFKQAVPSCLCMVLGMLQENINLIAMGHLNRPALIAGVGIGNMFMNMTGLSIVIGLNGALETLVSQAYGNKDL
jgi:Na+-driven multidrug efflux pump